MKGQNKTMNILFDGKYDYNHLSENDKSFC